MRRHSLFQRLLPFRAFALGASAVLAACGDSPVVAPPLATQLTLSVTAARIEVGETLPITAVARDTKDSVIANPMITWSATPAAVATVSNGVITGVAPGIAVVQATVQSASASMLVDVVPAAAATVVLTAPTTALAVSESVAIAAVVRNARQQPLSDRVVTWSSTDARVLQVSNAGLATAVGPGSAYVIARSEGVGDSLRLSVTPAATLTLEVAPGDVEVRLGRTRTLTARTRDANGTLAVPEGVTWSSDNAQVASVANGIVTGVGLGTTVIRAQSGAATSSAQVRVGPGGIVWSVGTATIGESVVRADSVHISGTLTATGPLTVISSGDIIVTGRITAPCHSLSLKAGGRVLIGVPVPDLSIPGLPNIDNGCGNGAEVEQAPAIVIEAAGGYRMVNTQVRTSGNVTVTNDAGLVTADFVGAPIARSSENCFMRAVSLSQQTVGTVAAGENGRDGAHVDVSCRGSFRAAFVSLFARAGAPGGVSTGEGNARGGDGGRSGTVRFRVTGDLTIDVRRLNFRAGGGGDGGRATATQTGNTGGHAVAIGGRGGDIGSRDRPSIEFLVAGDVIDNDPSTANIIELGVFNSGRGGNAVATAADGRAATDSVPAGIGGSATAIGGRSGDVYAVVVSVGGALPASALLQLGQGAGDAGSATATAGRGGAGSAAFPHGAPGGSAHADGGDGGSTTAVNSPSGAAASGADGGAAFVNGGNGGAGFDRCSPAGVGGIGGSGGRLTGVDGRAGTGQTNGNVLGLTIANAGNGGRGGQGSTAGAGGRAGVDHTQSRGPRVVTQPALTDGPTGGACPVPPP